VRPLRRVVKPQRLQTAGVVLVGLKRAMVLAVVALAGLSLADGSLAETITLDFDPPEFARGDTLSLVGDIRFVTAATVFTPTRVTTFSGNQALRVTGVCTTPECTNGAYRLQIGFGQPLPFPPNAMLWRRADRVAMRIGADSVNTPCFAEGKSCAIYADLSGYDAQGNRVADSRDVLLLDSLSTATAGSLTTPITREIEVSDPFAKIVRVVLVYGKDTFSHDSASALLGEPQIDHLEVSFPDAPPTPIPPAGPTVQISEPVNGSLPPYPYRTRLRGTVSMPGGLAAFCYRLNAPAPNHEVDCRNNGDLQSDSTFDIPIADSSLAAGANTLSVTVYDLWGQSATRTVTFTTQVPPPPRITISSPMADQWLSATQPTNVSGTVASVGALKGFCVLVDAISVPAPGTCLSDLGAIQGSNASAQPVPFGTFLAPQRFPPGAHTISVFAVDRWNQVGRADVGVNLPTNFRVVALEVTQGIQTEEIPININGSAAYSGVKLRQGVPTIVRVFADTSYAGSYSGASMLLAGFVPDPRLGERQLGSLLPNSKPSMLTSGPLSVPLAMRANPNGGYVFTLPKDWTITNGLRLEATLQLPFTLHECAGCAGDNDFSVTGINFAPPRQLTISPIALVYTNDAGVTLAPPAPTAVFAQVLNLSPVPASSVTVRPYVTSIDVSDVVDPATGGCINFSDTCQDTVFGRVTAFQGPADSPGYTIGVGPIDVGVEHITVVQHPLKPALEPIAIADSRQPLTAVGHEFYHELNYFHAGPECPGVDLWVFWPPDDKGYIQGVGLDRRQLTSAAGVWNGQYRILMPGTQNIPGGRANYYDLMSYCASESDAWISVQNWNKFDDFLPNGPWPDSLGHPEGNIVSPKGGTRPDVVQVDGGTLLASAVMDKSGNARFVHVIRGGKWLPKETDPRSRDFVFVVRGANGVVLARVAALVTEIRGHGASGTYAAAILPAKGAMGVELEHRGRTIGVLKRSGTAPTIRLKSPKAGVSLPRDKSLRVEWAASDAGSEKLEIRIEYASGPKRPFRTVFVGPNRANWTIPGSMLEAARRGRLRLVASDGFNQTAVTTGPIMVKPVPPELTILSPKMKMSFARSSPVRLEATAFGNNRGPLPPKQLTWLIDGRRVGSGRSLEAHGLKPGRHIAKLVARDGQLTSIRKVTFTIRRN
jgi:hypothetical protein